MLVGLGNANFIISHKLLRKDRKIVRPKKLMTDEHRGGAWDAMRRTPREEAKGLWMTELGWS